MKATCTRGKYSGGKGRPDATWVMSDEQVKCKIPGRDDTLDRISGLRLEYQIVPRRTRTVGYERWMVTRSMPEYIVRRHSGSGMLEAYLCGGINMDNIIATEGTLEMSVSV